jgi:hypothetical protein
VQNGRRLDEAEERARAAIKSTTARTLSVTPWPQVCAKTLEKIG